MPGGKFLALYPFHYDIKASFFIRSKTNSTASQPTRTRVNSFLSSLDREGSCVLCVSTYRDPLPPTPLAALLPAVHPGSCRLPASEHSWGGCMGTPSPEPAAALTTHSLIHRPTQIHQGVARAFCSLKHRTFSRLLPSSTAQLGFVHHQAGSK